MQFRYTQLSVGAVPDAATIGVITPAVDLMAMFERAKTIGQVNRASSAFTIVRNCYNKIPGH